MRDLFLDIVEKILDPLKTIKLSQSEMEHLLTFYKDGPQHMEQIKM